MFSFGKHQQVLPDLNGDRQSSRVSPQTYSPPSTANSESSYSKLLGSARLDTKKRDCEINEDPRGNCLLLINAPQVVNNSALVKQKVASAKDALATASMTTAANLPLMIGGRTKCVVNILGDNKESTAEITNIPQSPDNQSDSFHLQSCSVVPRNTALRAEQRRRNNVVSVVRPVMNLNNSPSNKSIKESSDDNDCDNSSIEYLRKPNSKVDRMDHDIKLSLIEELMVFEDKIRDDHQQKMKINDYLTGKTSSNNGLWDNFVNVSTQPGQQVNYMTNTSTNSNFLSNTTWETSNIDRIHQRHHIEVLNREQIQLDRSIKSQHKFFMSKIDQRKKHLQIILAVWSHKDFKHAIEKLVDFYYQGLIFTSVESSSINKLDHSVTGGQNSSLHVKTDRNGSSYLNSLNTPLIADVIGVIILRPKLWNLEICQLLLPIIVNDLLMQQSNQSKEDQREYSYVELALKSIKLILTHFSSVITSTLNSHRDFQTKFLAGVDLSREDRINRCLSCYKLLIEAQNSISRTSNGCKLSSLSNELQVALKSLVQANQESIRLLDKQNIDDIGNNMSQGDNVTNPKTIQTNKKRECKCANRSKKL